MPKTTPQDDPNSKEPDTTVEVSGGEIDVKEESGFYEAYAGFANNLRIWLLAYGIGAPVVLLSNEHAWKAIVDSEQGKFLAILFFAGVALQIIAAVMYKTAMWFLYMGELKKSYRKTKMYKAADYLSENYLIESGIDVATIVIFGVASFNVVRAITTTL